MKSRLSVLWVCLVSLTTAAVYFGLPWNAASAADESLAAKAPAAAPNPNVLQFFQGGGGAAKAPAAAPNPNPPPAMPIPGVAFGVSGVV